MLNNKHRKKYYSQYRQNIYFNKLDQQEHLLRNKMSLQWSLHHVNTMRD